jgi:hypothetical protein
LFRLLRPLAARRFFDADVRNSVFSTGIVLARNIGAHFDPCDMVRSQSKI